jgi:hypothetical protein
MVLLFALVFRIFYPKELLAYYKVDDQQAADMLRKRPLPANHLKRPIRYIFQLFDATLFRSIYFSFVLFFTPRFSSGYFAIGKSVLRWIIFEWLLGVAFVLLFLFYIASEYPIVTKLIGL